jgi:thioredoxin-related protein
MKKIISIIIFSLFMTSAWGSSDSPSKEVIKQGEFLGADFVESYPDWFKSSFLDFTEDLDEANESGRHVMIYFHQNGCPYCAKLVKDNFHNKELAEILKKNFDVIETNMWGDRDLVDWNGDEYTEKTFSAKMKVQFTPTVLFLNPEGKVILRLNGYQKSENFINILGFLHTHAYKNTSFSKYVASKRSKDLLKGDMVKSDLFNNQRVDYLLRSKANPRNKNLAVFFEQPNCQDCVEFHNELQKDKTLLKDFSELELIRLSIDSDEKIVILSGISTTPKEWYDDLNLTYKPSIVFFNSVGKEVIRKDGFLKAFHMESVIDYIQADGYKTEPKFQRFLEHRADKIREKGITVDLWK